MLREHYVKTIGREVEGNLEIWIQTIAENISPVQMASSTSIIEKSTQTYGFLFLNHGFIFYLYTFWGGSTGYSVVSLELQTNNCTITVQTQPPESYPQIIIWSYPQITGTNKFDHEGSYI